MSRLYAVESLFTLTGVNADHRLRLPASAVLPVAAAGLFVVGYFLQRYLVNRFIEVPEHVEMILRKASIEPPAARMCQACLQRCSSATARWCTARMELPNTNTPWPASSAAQWLRTRPVASIMPSIPR